jgi:hypothetical protein
MNPSITHKQILIAESELNRAQIAGDLAELTGTVRTLTGRVKFLGSMVTATWKLLHSFRNPAQTDIKPAWLPNVLEGIGLVATLWSAFRPQPASTKTE